MTLHCQNPQKIFNPNIVYLFSIHRRAVLGSRVLDYSHDAHLYYNFPWREFYAVRGVVTQENVDDYYIVDSDGLTYPVFMFVPCGKCDLCRAHKVEEWQTRCICESAMSDYKPLFLTLTYAPDKRPDNMDCCLRDFQLFMKRLRAYSARVTGEKSKIRYMAVSEWTPTNHYPHVHMLLWNMPYIPTKDGLSAFQSLCEHIQEKCWQNGFCKVEICRDSSGSYCMKYMRKSKDKDSWMKASRRRGIGYSFAFGMLPTVMRCPDLTSFSVTDKDGKVHKCLIPNYFKRIWFPTLSCIFPTKITKGAKDFMSAATKLYWFYQEYTNNKTFETNNKTFETNRKAETNRIAEKWRLQYILDATERVATRYFFMKVSFDDAVPSRKWRSSTTAFVEYLRSGDRSQLPDRRIIRRMNVPLVRDGLIVPKLTEVVTQPPECDVIDYPAPSAAPPLQAFEYVSELITLWRTFERAYSDLMSCEFDVVDVLRRLDVAVHHRECVSMLMSERPAVPLADLVDNCRRDNEWMQTHWMTREIG